MQVPVIHKLSHALNSQQNQNLTFLSQVLQSSSIAYNLCKWGALILALLATYRTILLIKLRQNPTSLPSVPFLIDDDDDYSDDEDDDGSSFLSEFEDINEEEEEEEERTSEYFRVRGSVNGDGGFLRCRSIGDIFSLSEIANSKSVVKLWDSLVFGFSYRSDVVSVYGVNEEQGGKTPTETISCASPAVVVSARENSSGNLALKIWDRRLRRRMPAVIAEWSPQVHVRDDGRYGLTVGDIRYVSLPLENVTESHLD